MHIEKIVGCLFGAAFGDAMGARTEFMSVDEIYCAFPPQGPTAPLGVHSYVTDDTQMMLAVGDALMALDLEMDLEDVERQFRREFVQWLNDPANNRAPGMSCLMACENLEKGLPWLDATMKDSKGCGANMRVAPVGLINVDMTKRAALAQFQSALTHGHPSALAASDLTAYTITLLSNLNDLTKLIEHLKFYADSQMEVYHQSWLGDLWKRPYINSSQEFIRRGWIECKNSIEKIEQALLDKEAISDPCLATGEGWIAEESYATGLLCFLLHSDDPVRALNRAAATSGDSDSIACLTGAFSGAYHGMKCWPEKWNQEIEYREEIKKLADFISAQYCG